MNLEEAEKIARIVETADHGCCYCVLELVDKLNKSFPQFSWEYEDYEPIVVRDAITNFSANSAVSPDTTS